MLKNILIISAIAFSAIFAQPSRSRVIENKTKGLSSAGILEIPPRPNDAISGSEFMESIKNMSITNRENAILNEILSGNIPDFLRQLVPHEALFNDLNGNPHQVKYWVMPDYLAIGSDTNFCRVPTGPINAQTAADSFGACMPTRKLVDHIYANAAIKLEPVTYTPVGNNNEKVEKFIEHNNAIEAQFTGAGGILGQLVGGTKKDVVLSNKITDPSRPDHVVIYGWHRLNGVPIQPLTNIHINTYVDYSHGIRLLDSDIIIDGDTTTIQNVLMDEILYKILSDEAGPMIQPTYILNPNLPLKPASFGIRSENEGEIKIVIAPDSEIEKYHLYLSRNGLDFDFPVTITSHEYIFNSLPPDSIFFIKLTAENSYGISPVSEVLAAVPSSSDENKVLVINGFDRSSDGNSYDFIRQHGNAIFNNGFLFESATNDAVTAGLFSLTDYPIADYILGDESTADETFSTVEQNLVSEFLESGGCLFVSGSEIAWDLDYKGSAGDKSFIMNYLKARYSADAPGGVSGTYYSAEGIPGELFNSLTQINFDNGTHGTFNVKYADALLSVGGSKAVMKYKNVSSNNIAGISYDGIFGSGTEAGKLIYLGFPFETIYPEEIRDSLMGMILHHFSDVTLQEEDYTETPDQFYLSQNYPNPFNPVTKIIYAIPLNKTPLSGGAGGGLVTLKVYDALGKEVAALINEIKEPGTYQLDFNASDLHSGVYFYRLECGKFTETKKMLLLK